jgi:hypothetical protein
VLAATVLAAPALARQGRGGFPGGARESGLPSDINSPRTIPQQFASKLKLDSTQRAAVDPILAASATEAVPSAQQMLQVRQRLLNAARASRPDDVKAAQDAYADAAARVADIEAATFAKIYAVLKPNQQKDAPQAFALIAGLFSNLQPGGGAARGGRGEAFPFSRLESLEENFKLSGDQKKAVKAALDQAHKGAAPVRQALLETHTGLGTAVQTAKSQEAIDAAARAHAEQAAAMARIEMEALASVIAVADPDLQNPQAIQAAFFMARGMFLKNNKWDEIPERNVPSY